LLLLLLSLSSSLVVLLPLLLPVLKVLYAAPFLPCKCVVSPA
jgi:hypothetical protein